MKQTEEMLSLKNWAVIGATKDKSKFGYRVYKKLKKSGYNVFAVNPGMDEIDGEKCFKRLDEIPEKIEVVSMIINPKIGMDVVEQAADLGIPNMWCQPGADSEELINKAEEKGINIIHNECVLVELR